VASIYDELTPTWLKNNFLVGVDLTLDDGSDYPEELYTNCIRSSVFHLEHELGIKIDQVTVTKERHDGIEMLRSGFFPFRLDKRPVHSISKANIQYGSYEPVELPIAWVQRVSDIHGQIHLIPSKDQLGSYSFHAGIPLIMGDILQPLDYIPGYFDFSYVAGFGHETGTVSISAGSTTSTVSFSSDFMDAEYTVTPTVTVSGSGGAQTLTASVSSKTDSEFILTLSGSLNSGNTASIAWRANGVPYDLRQAIGLMSAMLPMDTAGDLIAGAGIASISTSMDGLSSSVNTTSSATNAGLGARILSYSKRLKSMLPALRAKYSPINIAVV